MAYQQNIVEQGNWKLVMENNRECYHCDGHPELACALFPTWGLNESTVPPHLVEVWDRNQQAQGALEERCRRYGLPYAVIEELDTRTAGFRVSREPLDGQGESFSPTGRRLSKKLLGDLPDFRLGRCSLHIQPNSWFHLLGDHVITFAVFPINEHQTLVRTTWLVADDAQAGVDYEVESLTHTWKQTNLQDKAFVELCQAGAASPAYEPGPYMKSEYQVEAFITGTCSGCGSIWHDGHHHEHPCLRHPAHPRPGDALEPGVAGHEPGRRCRPRPGPLASAGIQRRMRGNDPRGRGHDDLRLPPYRRARWRSAPAST